MQKKIVITGASGFVGRQLVPLLTEVGFELLLVGREPTILDSLFPGISNCGYEEISRRARDYDAVVHLAVINNNSTSSTEDFKRVNVGLLENVLNASKIAGIRSFVNFTTFHALDDRNSSYSKSKRAALEVLRNQNEIAVHNIFLPAVYGEDFSGRLAPVKKLPVYFQPLALNLVSALAPTVHIEQMADYLVNDLGSVDRDVMLFNDQDKNPVFRTGKRLTDLLFAAAVVGLGGWLLVIIWGLVKFGSPGPGIFAQERIGKNGTLFTCYKFRTMKTGTKQVGTHELTPEAITGIGALLRKTKIDELPQVLNIVKGELSLVGPRPGLPVQKELMLARQKHGVYNVIPGITGLSQINGVDMSDPERLAKLDAQYIAQRGLIMDLKIVISTFLGRGQGDKVR